MLKTVSGWVLSVWVLRMGGFRNDNHLPQPFQACMWCGLKAVHQTIHLVALAIKLGFPSELIICDRTYYLRIFINSWENIVYFSIYIPSQCRLFIKLILYSISMFWGDKIVVLWFPSRPIIISFYSTSPSITFPWDLSFLLFHSGRDDY